MDLSLTLRSFRYPGGPELFAPGKLTLAAGQTVGLLGGTGSGKSSLLTLLAGLHPEPLGGRLEGTLEGLPPHDASSVVGYLGAQPGDFLTGFCASVMEEAGWTLFGWGWKAAEVEARVHETLQELQLESLLWSDPQRLSGGQQQMVALAAVWARRPTFLLLDQPASHLDPLTRRRLQETVAGLASSRGVGVIWATADAGEVSWCRTVWEVTPGAPVRVVAAQDWIPEETRAIPPWPRQWARLWGQPLPDWRATECSATGKTRWPSPPAPGPSTIEMIDVGYRPPGHDTDLLSSLRWSVRQSECVGLVGVNGAGKTTLARLLRGLLRPSSGTITVDGVDVGSTAVSALAGLVAYTFQDPSNLFLKTRVDAELAFSGELLGWPKERALRRMEQALDLFALRDCREAHPRELPAGLAALLGVALSWYSAAPLQILDEPLARLDMADRAVLERALQSWREDGTTVLIIAHDLDWLSTVCTSFAVLHEGRMAAQGDARSVFQQVFVQETLGAPLPFVPSSS